MNKHEPLFKNDFSSFSKEDQLVLNEFGIHPSDDWKSTSLIIMKRILLLEEMFSLVLEK